MKANVRDQYDFEQLSPSQKPGFEVFYSKTHKAWFFHANDVKGKPILFSQAYQSAETAEKGMQSAWKNIEKGRIYKRTEGEQSFLTVVAGNNQEVGRSPYFKDEKVVDNVLSFLKQVASASNPMVSKEMDVEGVEEREAIMDDKPLRSYFRVYFYKNSDGDINQLSGRIEDITDEKSAVSFQGIDAQAIIGFMRQKLERDFEPTATGIAASPSLAMQVSDSTQVAPPLPNKPQTSTKVTQASTLSDRNISLVNFENQKLSIEKGIYSRTTPSVKLFMTFSDAQLHPEGRIIGSEIIALEADTQRTTRLQAVEMDINSDKKGITFGFSPAHLPASGTYRLEAIAWLANVNQEVVNLRGTCWAYFL